MHFIEFAGGYLVGGWSLGGRWWVVGGSLVGPWWVVGGSLVGRRWLADSSDMLIFGPPLLGIPYAGEA